LERWRQQCQESYRESRQRHELWAAWHRVEDGQEPYAGGPLPFSSRHPLSLADCYLVLALVHNAERRDAGRINPFSPDDEDGLRFYEAQQTHVHKLRQCDRMTLDDCLARIEATRPEQPPEQVSPVARAIGIMLDYQKKHGELMPIPALLKLVPDISKSALYRDPRFKAAREAIRKSRFGTVPKGHRIQGGGVEAEDYESSTDE
jgi:hypothetical protein